EGIGLIEAMGLFVLPGRLKKQLAMIADILCGETEYDVKALSDKENYLYVHRDMIQKLVEEYPCGTLTKEQADSVVKDYVNVVCKHILENTAVFKDTADGKAGFERFMRTIGATKIN
ncbi:MAG: galactose-1-phosphate uridylyltransferase, partial [Clostridia bacterium]|nr:galactose-1-phosphate uridylyltransferase [Clostridia bacterium]